MVNPTRFLGHTAAAAVGMGILLHAPDRDLVYLGFLALYLLTAAGPLTTIAKVPAPPNPELPRPPRKPRKKPE